MLYFSRGETKFNLFYLPNKNLNTDNFENPKFYRHAGPDPASRSRNVLKRRWIPAFAGMTWSVFHFL